MLKYLTFRRTDQPLIEGLKIFKLYLTFNHEVYFTPNNDKIIVTLFLLTKTYIGK